MALSVAEASSITLKTLPYIFLRMLVYLGAAMCFFIYWIVVFFVGQGAAHIHENVRVAVWIVALILPFPLLKLFREYFLYMLKAGHVAVITQLVLHGSLPEGASQVEWGKQQVMNRFKETSALFLVDRLVNGVIQSINGIMQGMGNAFSGVPGMESIMKFAGLVLRFSLTYMDEAILARNFMTPQETVWQSAKNGLLLYAQSWKEILKTAFILGLVALFAYSVLFVLCAIPVFALGAMLHLHFLISALVSLTFAAALKLALLDPWALTNMILVYVRSTQGKEPDASWESKLEAVSSKFRQIKEKALA
ncbi:MAG: hypothetical protein HQM15_09615 [Deltaproteobacteria bacterium]|nr:hypothetical protein [Deltaproteobacteria bacterium]